MNAHEWIGVAQTIWNSVVIPDPPLSLPHTYSLPKLYLLNLSLFSIFASIVLVQVLYCPWPEGQDGLGRLG